MKTRVVELSIIESDMILRFSRQPKDTPVPSALCRAINLHLSGEDPYGARRVRLRQVSHARITTAMPEKG